MRGRLFVLAVLVVAPALAFSQSPKHQSKITGCLTAGQPNDYRLVDQRGVTNYVYSDSASVHLDSYVGQSVTLIGDQSAMTGTDTGTGRTSRRFKVLKVEPASGSCKK
jgi:hypothetical protein